MRVPNYKVSSHALDRVKNRWPAESKPKNPERFLVKAALLGEDLGYLETEKASLRYLTPVTVLVDEIRNVIITAVIGRKDKVAWSNEVKR